MCVSSVLLRRAALAIAASACFSVSVQAADSATELDTVVVTTSRTAQSLQQALAPITVIERAQIERRQVNSLPELLRGEAGISLANSGGPGKATSVFLRGTESDHVVVLVDGVKIGSATLGGAAWQDIPLEQIERIEIARGPFSSLYGSEAIGGVIQIFTRRPQGQFVPTLGVAFGSDNARRYSGGVAGRSQGDLSERGGWYSVNAVHDETDGINAYLNTADSGYDPDRDGYRNDSLNVAGGWRFNPQWDADVQALRAESRNEYDGSIYSGNLAKNVQQVVGGSLRYVPSDGLKFTASAGASSDLADSYYDSVYISTYDTRHTYGTLQADVDAGPGLLTVGFDWQRDEVESSDTYDRDRRTDRAGFAQWQQRFGTQSLQASLRRNDNSQFGGKTTGSLLWGWDFADHLRLTASYGTAFKAPTFNELYYPAYGNPLLGPETSQSVELGLRGAYDWGNWTLNAFQTRAEDLIAYDSSLLDAAHPFGQPNNIDKARIRGIEAGYDTTVAGWTLRTALTWLDPRADGQSNHGNWLPRRARQSGRVDLDRSFGDVSVGASLFAAGRRYEDLANATPLAGYGLFDLRMSYAVSASWNVGLSANNVFDRQYETARWYNQPGRSYLLTLRYHPAQ